jgi:hypothetical protein
MKGTFPAEVREGLYGEATERRKMLVAHYAETAARLAPSSAFPEHSPTGDGPRILSASFVPR